MKPEATSPLSLTVHSLEAPDLAQRQRTASGRWKMLAVLAVCAAPVIASYFTYFVIRPQARTNYSDIISPSVPVPETLPLADLSGQPVNSQSLKGQWLLVVVAEGSCDVTCEKQLLLQRQLRETLGREKDRVDKVLLITDNHALRPELINALTAVPAVTTLRISADSLGTWLRPASGQVLSNHLYLVDPMGAWMLRTPPNPEPAKFKRDVERLLRASSSWDRPGR